MDLYSALPTDSSRLRNRLVIVAPLEHSADQMTWGEGTFDTSLHTAVLESVQRLRGSLYLKDGAISASALTPDGRHEQRDDHRAYHVAVMDDDGELAGCMRLLRYENTVTFDDLLPVKTSALATSADYAFRLRRGVDALIDRARRDGLQVINAGGWAIAEKHRRGTVALRVLVGLVGLGRALGGCVGLATATTRHRSSSAARRFGARSVVVDGVELPPYFDPHYGCDMEMLEIDSEMGGPFLDSHLATRAEPLVVHRAHAAASTNRLLVAAR